MKSILSTIIVFFALLHFIACDNCIEGDGKIVSKQVDIGGVTGIKLDCLADVEIVTDSSLPDRTAEITAESNIIELVDLEKHGSTLKISTKSCILDHEPVIIRLKMKKPATIKVNGSGTVLCKDTVLCDELDLDISGSGSIEMNIDAHAVNSRINGSGDISLGGKTRKLKVTINGSGEVKSFDLKSEKAFVNINGSGDCNCYAMHELDVKIAGSGDVYYKGDPRLTYSVRGSGNLIRK